MFDSIGWGEILVLVVAGLFILGPERLPGAAAWLGKTTRQIRDYASGAREQLRTELGPEFDELRQPLNELRGLRGFDPGSAVRRTLFDDDRSPRPADPGAVKPNGYTPNQPGGSQPVRPLSNGERPPIDPDAT